MRWYLSTSLWSAQTDRGKVCENDPLIFTPWLPYQELLMDPVICARAHKAHTSRGEIRQLFEFLKLSRVGNVKNISLPAAATSFRSMNTPQCCANLSVCLVQIMYVCMHVCTAWLIKYSPVVLLHNALMCPCLQWNSLSPRLSTSAYVADVW